MTKENPNQWKTAPSVLEKKKKNIKKQLEIGKKAVKINKQ